MRSQDKNNLIISGVLIGLLVIVAIIWSGTRMISLFAVAGVALAVEIFYLMPSVCKKYYEFCGVEEGMHWIPYVNVIQCFNGVLAIASVVLTVVGAFCMLFLKLPTFVHKLFGENFMIDYADSMFYYGVAILLVESVVWGIGYAGIYRTVKSELEGAGLVATLSDLLFMTTLFIPGFRAVGLMNLNTNLDAVLNMTMEDDDDDFEGVDEDE